MSIFRPEMKVNPSQLVTTGTPSASTYLAGDGSYKEIDLSYPSTWYWADTSFYAKTVSVAADRYTVLTPNAMQIDIGGTSYTLTSQQSIDLSVAANWDDYASDSDWDSTNYTTAANRAGKDFYIYAVQPGSGSVPLFLLSTNSTVPLGNYSESTSRKVAGFHCLCASMSTPGTRANNTAYALGYTILSGSNWYRCSTAGTSAASPPTLGTTIGGTTTDGTAVWVCEPIHPASGYVTGDIIPNSVWDLKFREASGNNAGLAYVDKLDQWWFIYFQSGEGPSTTSAYNGTIKDTRMWFDHVDDLANRKSILPDDQEFQIASQGSNQKTNIAGGLEFHTTGGHSDTAGRRMISNYFLEDMCGGLWQWLRDQCFQVGSGSAGWKDVVGGLNGQVYLMADNAHIKVIAGGCWVDGVYSGSRARAFNGVGWNLSADISARGSCGSIKK